MRKFSASLCLLLGLLPAAAAAQSAPSIDDFKRALEKSLLALQPEGFTERQVLFGNVRQGRANGNLYPFQADVVIRDYGPGHPANRYYGQTCVGKMDGWKFDMRQDQFGDWIVQGAMTVTNGRQCQDNPAQGVSTMPLEKLKGTPAPKAATGDRAKPQAANNALPLGEYACYGTGGRPMAGMGFKLGADGRYTDIDGARGGRYKHDPAAGTLKFEGGYMSGQTGQRDGGSFAISNTVSCEPWR